MLDKAIATLASVGAEVYPDFNVFEVAKPYARGLLADRYQPRIVAQRLRTEALALGSIARELPYQVSDVLEHMRDGPSRSSSTTPASTSSTTTSTRRRTGCRWR